MDGPIFPGGGPPRSGSSDPGPGAPLRRVVVVDDDPTSAESLALVLRLEGYEVRVAYDGESALEMVREFGPEILLSDIGLPGIDGCELARRVLRDPWRGAGLKLLASLTGNDAAETRRRSRESGFGHHFIKPFDPEAILSLLASIEWTDRPTTVEPVGAS